MPHAFEGQLEAGDQRVIDDCRDPQSGIQDVFAVRRRPARARGEPHGDGE